MANFAERLKQAREKLGMKPGEFADACGVQQSSQYRYEKGRSPNGEYLAKLADLGLDVNWLLTGALHRENIKASEPPASVYSMSAKLAAEIASLNLSQEDAEALLHLARRLARP